MDVEEVRMVPGNEESVPGGFPGEAGREGSGETLSALTGLKEAAEMFTVHQGRAFSQQYGGISGALKPVFNGLRYGLAMMDSRCRIMHGGLSSVFARPACPCSVCVSVSDGSTETVMLALDALLSVLSVAGPEVSPLGVRVVQALVEAPLGDSR